LQQIAAMPQGTPPEAQLQAMIQLLVYIKQQSMKPKTGTYDRQMLVREWDRPVDEGTVREEFIPEFDLKVKVVDERPTDRNYYTNLAVTLFGKALGLKALWYTLDNGKFPPTEDIIKEVEAMQQAQSQAQLQALRAQMQTEQQENEKDRQASLTKQNLTNQSQLQMTALAAMAKAGGKNAQT
jgi:hypothetical protein